MNILQLINAYHTMKILCFLHLYFNKLFRGLFFYCFFYDYKFAASFTNISPILLKKNQIICFSSSNLEKNQFEAF
jgi:hypothetical protein